jgi:hypothetical protein
MTRDIAHSASSQISSIKYDDETLELFVRFSSNGKTYCYSSVPVAVADGFSVAVSAGKYLNAAVKNIYSYSEV